LKVFWLHGLMMESSVKKVPQVKANVGVAVRNIRLVHDNIEQIEGKVDGQQIVILTKFVKKS
jgi:protein PhnA